MNGSRAGDDTTFKKRFFEGMSFAAATVNVVTTDGPTGRAGVTVSAMSSVSADTPRPTLLVCINENSAAAGTILENGVFCVNVLKDHQSFISDAFAGRCKDRLRDKFDCTDWKTGDLGVPRVADALVAFDCRIASTKKVGTHHVCFGEVEDIHLGGHGSALIYANRAYGSSSRLDTARLRTVATAPGRGRLKIGCFHTFAPFIVPRLAAALTRTGALSIDLAEGDARRMREGLLAGEIDLAFMYASGRDPGLDVTPLFDLEPYILLAEDHPLAGKAELTAEDLSGQDMISVSEEASRHMLEGALRSAGAEPNVVFRSPSFEIARGMVGHGLGFAVLMTKPASSVTYDGMAVISRRLAVRTKPGRIGLAHRSGPLGKAASAAKEAALALFAHDRPIPD